MNLSTEDKDVAINKTIFIFLFCNWQCNCLSNKFLFDLIISISLGKVFCFVFSYILSEEEI